jgi:hypothetical protein
MSWLWWRPPAMLRSVIVNLKDDDLALSGVLWGARGPWLTLRNASLLKPNEPPVPTDGEVLVPRANVAFIQVETTP